MTVEIRKVRPFPPPAESSIPDTSSARPNGAHCNHASPSASLKIRKICCIGAGYVGGPTCAVFANKLPDVECTVVDLNVKRIEAWNSTRLPIYEPNLAEILKPARDGIPGERSPNLFFTAKVEPAIASADLVFISVNTPAKATGAGAGGALDLAFVESATRQIAEVAQNDMIVVEKSTVPCKTADTIRDILSANGKPGVRFDVLSNPEFLAEGTAITDLLYPDRILIGSLQDERSVRAATALADLYAQWVPRDRIITLNLWSSELAKLAANAFLAQRISSINALSAICEATGANVNEVSYAVGLDKRIGPHMLKSSVGFGGSCFRKDVLNLVYLSDSLNLPQVATYWRAVLDINEWQKDRFIKTIISSLYNTLSNKKVALFGFAYKKNTGDTRESAAISITNSLIAERAQVNIYDPHVREDQIWQELYMSNDRETDVNDCVKIFKDPYEACEAAHAIVIATEWDEFRVDAAPGVRQDENVPLQISTRASLPEKDVAEETAPKQNTNRVTGGRLPSGSGADARSKDDRTSIQIRGGQSEIRKNLDWTRLARLMLRPMFVFDGRNIVDAQRLEELGFRVHCIGNARTGQRR